MAIVFDAEPFLAMFLGEPGGAETRDLLKQVASGQEEAWVSVVNLAEIAHQLMGKAPRYANDLMNWIAEAGVMPASVDGLWLRAAAIKAAYGVGLADAFALATAEHLDARLIVRSDPDFQVAARLGVRLHRVK